MRPDTIPTEGGVATNYRLSPVRLGRLLLLLAHQICLVAVKKNRKEKKQEIESGKKIVTNVVFFVG